MKNQNIEFNATKNEIITLTNTDIDFIAENGRAKVMQRLNIKESWARKLIDAVKNGDLVKTANNSDTNFDLYYTPRVLKNSQGDQFGIGRYTIVTSPSGKKMPKRLSPSKTALLAWENGCRNVDEFVNFAIQLGVSVAEGKTWFRRTNNWFN